MTATVFQGFYEITDIDPHGKKFERGWDFVLTVRIVASSENIISELICDINTEIYPLEMGDKFTLLLVNSLTDDNADTQDKATWKGEFKSIADDYDYVMYGKVYKCDDSVSGKIACYISFGGLLMCLSGDYRALQEISTGQYLYMLMRKIENMTLFDHFESQISLEEESTTKFQFDKVQFEFPSELISFKVENNILVLGFRTKFLWIDLSRPNAITEVSVKDLEDVYLSRLGNQLIVTCSSGENYYYKPGMSSASGSSKSNKNDKSGTSKLLSLLSKIQGRISSVAFPKTLHGPILVATRGGSIYELELVNQPKFKERVCQNVYNTGSLVSGIEWFIDHGRIVVIVTTGDRVFQFVKDAGVTLGTVMQEPLDVQEMHSSPHPSQFCIYDTTFCWLTAPGIYTGTLAVTKSESILENINLVPYPTVRNKEVQPLGLELTPYHYILLLNDACLIVNRLDTSITYLLKVPLSDNERVVSLQSDFHKNTYWISTTTSLYEILVVDEEDGIWKIYFDRGMLKEAMELAKGGDKMMVAERYADKVLDEKDYELAAELYAKTDLPLEQVSLRLLKVDESSRPLRLYLGKRLATLPSKYESQAIMISSWILELLLIEYDIQEDNLSLAKGSDFVMDTEEIKSFLKANQASLNVPTVYSLFNRHGRQNLALMFAEMIQDYETLTQLYLHNEEWSKALTVIGSTTNKSLFYKHSPILIQHIPTDLITLWKRSPFLNPRMLLPAMLKHEISLQKSNDIILYLQHAIETGNKDNVIHNYLLYLHVQKQGNEEEVLRFIKSQQDKPIFDVQYALRICTLNNMLQACIQLYLMLEMEKEALKLALKGNNIILAKQIVTMVDDDEVDLRNELWLDIAKFVVLKQKDYKSALGLVREGGLKVEQVLKFFPDFVLIDQVKEDLLEALRRYNSELEQLSKELDDSANNTELIRNDIKALKSR